MTRITILSGLAAKGPASILVEARGARLLLDLGRGPEPGAEVPLAGLGPVDALLLSHGHADHAGALDRLEALGHPPVWATAELRAFAALPAGGMLPLQGTVEIAGLRVTLGRAGHAPGGVWLHLAIEGGILYTGDLFDRSELFAFDPPPAARTLLLDASYGLDPTPLDERRAAVLAALDRPHGLLPAPPDGRGPELALALERARGRAPTLCPATRAAIGRLLGPARASLRPGMAEALAGLLEAAPPWNAAPSGLVVAAGAKLDRGPAAELARAWADRADARIVLTGHVPRGSPAFALLETDRAVQRRWPVHPDLACLESLVASTGAERLVPLFDGRPDPAAWASAFPDQEIRVEPVVEGRSGFGHTTVTVRP